MLIRNPYGFYAHKILGLRKLEDIARTLSAADFGNFVHKAIENYYAKHTGDVKDAEKALSSLLEQGTKVFSDVLAQPSVELFWWPRFEHIARWLVAREREQYKALRFAIMSETTLKGDVIVGEGRVVTLTSKVDRIEVYPNGEAAIVDYKTGSIPTKKIVESGISCQLPVGGMLWLNDHPNDEVSLQYWSLKGKKDKNEICDAFTKNAQKKQSTSDIISDIEAKMHAFLNNYLNEDSAFLVVPLPEAAPAYDDYKHLSRMQEWNS
jgi:ATP-dependent helicase/nuclease subunit B